MSSIFIVFRNLSCILFLAFVLSTTGYASAPPGVIKGFGTPPVKASQFPGLLRAILSANGEGAFVKAYEDLVNTLKAYENLADVLKKRNDSVLKEFESFSNNDYQYIDFNLIPILCEIEGLKQLILSKILNDPSYNGKGRVPSFYLDDLPGFGVSFSEPELLNVTNYRDVNSANITHGLEADEETLEWLRDAMGGAFFPLFFEEDKEGLDGLHHVIYSSFLQNHELEGFWDFLCDYSSERLMDPLYGSAKFRGFLENNDVNPYLLGYYEKYRYHYRLRRIAESFNVALTPQLWRNVQGYWNTHASAIGLLPFSTGGNFASLGFKLVSNSEVGQHFLNGGAVENGISLWKSFVETYERYEGLRAGSLPLAVRTLRTFLDDTENDGIIPEVRHGARNIITGEYVAFEPGEITREKSERQNPITKAFEEYECVREEVNQLDKPMFGVNLDRVANDEEFGIIQLTIRGLVLDQLCSNPNRTEEDGVEVLKDISAMFSAYKKTKDPRLQQHRLNATYIAACWFFYFQEELGFIEKTERGWSDFCDGAIRFINSGDLLGRDFDGVVDATPVLTRLKAYGDVEDNDGSDGEL